MIDKVLDWCCASRKTVVVALLIVTAVMAAFASRVEIKTVFGDLLPRNHPFVKVNEQFKQAYGGSNIVSIMIEVKEGDILNLPVLAKIKKITEEVALIPGADPFQVTSLASKKLKEITATTEGIATNPLMWPDLPRTDEDLYELRRAITNNPLVYGAYVSRDFKAALITVDFYDHLLDYRVFYDSITHIINENKTPDIEIRVVGEPMLYGWVIHYFGETERLFLGTIVCLFLVLFVIARTWHGTIIPLLAAGTSAVWAIGFAGALGFNLDPLVVVVAFLITALAISNSIQIVQRFDHKLTAGIEPTSEGAARAALKKLFRPAMLAVVADAGCMIVVAMTPIPVLQKIAFIGGFWVLSLAFCAVILPGVATTWIKGPIRFAHPINLKGPMHVLLRGCSYLATSQWRHAVILASLAILMSSGIYALNLKVGDANPGSPILHSDATYNVDARALNSVFQGADRMFVVLSGDKGDTIKDPAMLSNMEALQRYMEAQPEVGGSLSIVDVLPAVNRTLHEGNPRYLEPGPNAGVNGELGYLFVSGSDPGDLQRYVSPDYRNASVTLFLRDHQGDTIRSTVARIQEFTAANPPPQGEYLLAGGLAGVLAAVNDVILAGQIEAIAFALLILVLLAAVTYRSLAAGTFFMIPVVLSNTLTFSYMAYYGIGMNINTLPVVALGIGLGVDYSFYVVDAIREEMHHDGDLNRSIRDALHSAGMGVLTTVLTLVVSVSLWSFSSLRLQSEMAALIAIWLTISAAAALILMPALVYVFKPAFVVGRRQGAAKMTAGLVGAA
ncbi:MAG: efflux RND transporter permease subunit [Parvibaculum sp.]|uniref:efflux RND transporter permease subunit n=1 Tax=Parvibaculum sp. TaxID=2024848 RepID=UPI003C732AC5